MRAARRVHRNAIESGESADALHSIGGVFALAGDDVRRGIRVQEDKYLGFIDGEASQKTVSLRISNDWKRWEHRIRAAAARARTPQEGVLVYFQSLNPDLAPQTTESLKHMMVWTIGPLGHMETWRYDVAKIRDAFRRGLDVLTGPSIGAVTAGVTAFAKGGWHPTAEDWNEAFAIGELVQTAENMASALPITARQRATERPPSNRPAVTSRMTNRGTSGPPRSVPGVRPKTVRQPRAGSASSPSTPRARARARSPSGPASLPKRLPPKPAQSAAKQGPAKSATRPRSARKSDTQDRRNSRRTNARPPSAKTGSGKSGSPAQTSAAPAAQLQTKRALKGHELEILGPYSEPVKDFFRRYEKVEVNQFNVNEVDKLFRSTGRAGGRFKASRAAATELESIHRFNANPNVKKITALKVNQTKGARTADLKLDLVDGGEMYAEITTVTSARGNQQQGVAQNSAGEAVRAAPPRNHVRRPTNSTIRSRFMNKIKRGQISAKNPGVIVVKVNHRPKNGVFLTEKNVRDITKAAARNPGIRELILIAPSARGGRQVLRIGDSDSGLGLTQGEYKPPK